MLLNMNDTPEVRVTMDLHCNWRKKQINIVVACWDKKAEKNSRFTYPANDFDKAIAKFDELEKPGARKLKRFVMRRQEIVTADFEIEAYDEQDAEKRYYEWIGASRAVYDVMQGSDWWDVESEIIGEDAGPAPALTLTDADYQNL